MSYHNIRDSKGRFTKKKRTYTRRHAKVRPPEKFNPKDVLIVNVFLLDDSASMGSKVEATVTGFNKILADTERDSLVTGTANYMVLSKFGSPGRHNWQVGVTPLSSAYGALNRYAPNQSSTALHDAIAYGLRKTAQEVLHFTHKTIKVIFTVFTDGLENSSCYSTLEEVRALIKDKQAQGWVINFIGAGLQEEVEKISGSMGFFASNSLGYSNDAVGTKMSMTKMSASNTSYRSKVASGIEVSTDGFFSND